MKPQIPWLRVFVEGVVIVGSILLAFGLQAWWEERQERGEELAILIRLDAELDEAAAHLLEWRTHQQGVAQAGRIILANTGTSGTPAISSDSIGNLIWTATFDWDADPPTGVLSSVISTGQLAIIQNQDLRAALVRWETSFRDLRRAEQGTADMNDRRVIPFLETQIAWRKVISTIEGTDLGPSSFSFGVRDALANREFENVMANRVIWVDVVVAKYDLILEGLDSTRSLLKAELSERR